MPKKPDQPITVKQAGALGGKARAEALTPEQRSKIAKKAAAARWKKQRPRNTKP